ncbi:hypothetical protein A6V39_05340 [Candidatus Mycoplasma haematobovis]|uniref:Uncharacterized protein n=1 Tax=Candidatus Mycoplasma haematobovis TaxID=432608 RepID=A0A1A9QDJ1_9MOLU|nr:hypothetical protein [Candidatus Mycoplasma haematobovis]OAL09759.1 hypothetical protein A6V39_05340 [Candidatus Mycoplasma haematobovis]
MWSLTEVLIFSGAAIAGGGGGGWAIYRAIQESVEAEKRKNDAFWNSKLIELEKELVKLRKKSDGSYNDLASKIVPKNFDAVFDLNNSGTAFEHGKREKQRNALSVFCNSSRKREIDPEVAKRICEK